MSRRINATAIVLTLLVSGTAAVAQVRVRPGGDQRGPVTGTIREAPSTRSAADRAEHRPPPTDTRSRSMLTFERRAFDARQLPVVPFQFGLGWGSFGVVPWSYGGMPALDAAPALVVPPTQSAPTGGMQLDIDPRSAEVYVDGIYAGVVSDFSGYFNHMELSGGLHFVTIMAPKYDPLFLQIVVTPGHTATYRGALTRSNDQ